MQYRVFMHAARKIPLKCEKGPVGPDSLLPAPRPEHEGDDEHHVRCHRDRPEQEWRRDDHERYPDHRVYVLFRIELEHRHLGVLGRVSTSKGQIRV